MLGWEYPAVPQTPIVVLPSQFAEKGFEKTKNSEQFQENINSEQNAVLLFFLFTLNIHNH